MHWTKNRIRTRAIRLQRLSPAIVKGKEKQLQGHGFEAWRENLSLSLEKLVFAVRNFFLEIVFSEFFFRPLRFGTRQKLFRNWTWSFLFLVIIILFGRRGPKNYVRIFCPNSLWTSEFLNKQVILYRIRAWSTLILLFTEWVLQVIWH